MPGRHSRGLLHGKFIKIVTNSCRMWGLSLGFTACRNACASPMKKRTISALLKDMMLRGLRILVWLWLCVLWLAHLGRKDDGDRCDFP
jgi:hypothetical protein